MQAFLLAKANFFDFVVFAPTFSLTTLGVLYKI